MASSLKLMMSRFEQKNDFFSFAQVFITITKYSVRLIFEGFDWSYFIMLCRHLITSYCTWIIFHFWCLSNFEPTAVICFCCAPGLLGREQRANAFQCSCITQVLSPKPWKKFAQICFAVFEKNAKNTHFNSKKFLNHGFRKPKTDFFNLLTV